MAMPPAMAQPRETAGVGNVGMGEELLVSIQMPL
jgi:hypothetical protein